ncbi:hypothetical protein FACS1894187_13630 [Synergistales bacterium]|nr:hypothetical protein FACS1894187_13630 [Synergistales bacterium]
MILFLSQLSPNAKSAVYTTDCGDVEGLQTNEAPVRYALKRLEKNRQKLDRIIVLVTPTARNTALAQFTETVKAASPDTEIIPLDISDSVTTVELLGLTIDKLFPVAPEDSVIIETTGGYRNAINALTLFSRFLRHSGVNVLFSTFSDFNTKTVSDTREADELWELLDAVNLFAVTGNPKGISKALKNVKGIPEKTEFVKAMREFYDTILCCKISRLDSAVEKLRGALDGINNATISENDSKLLVFRDLVREIVAVKMAFIHEEHYLKSLVDWLLDNDYIQQAVTVVWEKYKQQDGTWPNGKPRHILPNVTKEQSQKVRTLRNNFNHANGGELNDSADNVKNYFQKTILPNL